MATHELAAIAEDRSRIYWLLSRFYLAPPDAAFLDELRQTSPASVDSADTGLAAVVAQLRQCAVDASPDELSVEHTRLFGGVREGYGPPPPFESLHREGRLLGDSTEAVMAHYRGNGISLADEIAGPADHLGVELKFVALMCHGESRCWQDGDLTGGHDALAAQRAFIDQHLQSWVPAYCRTLQAEARNPFYRALADLTVASIDLDRRHVAGLLDELSPTGIDTNTQGGLQ